MIMSESRVVVVRSKGSVSAGGEFDKAKILLMLERGLCLLAGTGSRRDAWRTLFTERDRVGIKVNTIGGRRISTRPEMAFSLAESLSEIGISRKNIAVWDRTNRELREAGYRLNLDSSDYQVMGTDTDGLGYEAGITAHLNIGSRFSSIQSRFVTASVSLAILKDHGLAGVTAGMKNYFGAIHNPNKYHDANCNPYVAEVFDVPLVKAKHRLTILDAVLVQFHRGPSFHPQWAEPFGGLIFSVDPVAADAFGWRVLEKLRAQKGLPSLMEENREPGYLRTAEAMGLGTADPEKIRIIEDEVS
jgi:uncharacterized protein (DUF362 family)